MSELRAAIVGTGGIANSHAQAVHALPDRTRLVAAVDVDEDRLRTFCARHEIPSGSTDLGRMLEAERPDLVHICTPPGTHADIVVRCLEAGASVWCEKPLCASLAELDRIEAAERATGRSCSSVFQWRFGSAGQHLKQLIEREAMGRSLVGLCDTTWFRDAAYYSVPWRGRWDTEIGGCTMGHGIHAIDFFLWLLGDWEEVTAMIGTIDRDIKVEDVSMATVRFANGGMGSIVNSVLSPRQETYLRFDFQKCTVEVRALYSYANDDWCYTPLTGAEVEAEQAGWARIEGDARSSHLAQLTALLDSFDRGEQPPASAGDVRGTFEFLSALYRSAATGEAVRRGAIGPGDPFYAHVAGTLAAP